MSLYCDLRSSRNLRAEALNSSAAGVRTAAVKRINPCQ